MSLRLSPALLSIARTLALLLPLIGLPDRHAIGAMTIEQRIAEARTRADHAELAMYYEQEALSAEDRAASHRRVLAAYQRSSSTYSDQRSKPRPGTPFDRQCKLLILQTDGAAKSYAFLAKLHRKLAAKAPDQ